MNLVLLARSSAIVLAAAACTALSFSACATTTDAEPKGEPSTGTVPESDAGLPPDAGGDSCAERDRCAAAVDCDQVDFCPIELSISTLVTLNAVWGSGPNDVWAVGTRGTILHGDGAAFLPIAVPPTAATDIYVAVWGTSSTDVWVLGPSFPLHAAGYEGATTTFEPREGASWNAPKAATGRIWAGASAGGAVWLAGEESARFGAASSFWSLGADGNGAPIWNPELACTDAQPCDPAVRGLWALDANLLFAVGRDGQTFSYDAADVTDAAPARWLGSNSNTRDDLEAVWGSGPDDVWAVGRRGTIRHTTRGAATWTVTASPTTSDLHAVWGSGPKDVWAVGDSGTIVHFDGTSWAPATLAMPNGDLATNLYGVWGSGPDDVWIVGEGLILHRTAASRRRP